MNIAILQYGHMAIVYGGGMAISIAGGRVVVVCVVVVGGRVARQW